MRKIRGFKIGKRLVRISTWICRRTRIHPPDYNLLGQSESTSRSKPKPISKIINWGRRLTKGAKSLCCSKPGSGYIPMGHELVCDKPVTVPKGHLAIYVGQEDGDFHRVLVPVIYFNHPLFGELLREAEEPRIAFCGRVREAKDCKGFFSAMRCFQRHIGDIPKKISIMARKPPCGLVLAGVAISRSVDGSMRREEDKAAEGCGEEEKAEGVRAQMRKKIKDFQQISDREDKGLTVSSLCIFYYSQFQILQCLAASNRSFSGIGTHPSFLELQDISVALARIQASWTCRTYPNATKLPPWPLKAVISQTDFSEISYLSLDRFAEMRDEGDEGRLQRERDDLQRRGMICNRETMRETRALKTTTLRATRALRETRRRRR
ncbi:hypothetical protein DKX38_020808 [Salix brachista]|uniref:Auxin-responsive protein n=1 Tax=Salix brachista TaxID=2182728 RepID=A0A5N5K686_9ROSI|nr:hypothetical protein DKX38_020808 [Salix brachista]